MKKIVQFRSEEDRYDEASLWVERLSEGLSAEEEAALRDWLAEDAANQVVLEKMAMLWDKMDSLSRLSALVPHPQPVKTAVSTGSRKSYLAVAASLFLGLSVLLLWNVQQQPGSDPQIAQRPAEIVYETAIGEQQVQLLEDGTKITLNTASRVSVRYTVGARLLHLESGEVHVQVAKDQQRPLSVVAGAHVVQAIGTAFNIELREDREIELVVTEGTVRIGKQAQAMQAPLRSVEITLPGSATIITAGQELVTGEEDEAARSISVDDIKVRLSWREGNLIFKGETLAEAAGEIERYTGVEFVFVDEDLKQVRVSGFFRAGDVEGMLAVLKENFDIEFQRETDKRVLLYGM